MTDRDEQVKRHSNHAWWLDALAWLDRHPRMGWWLALIAHANLVLNLFDAFDLF
jgi:hypothetical protein